MKCQVFSGQEPLITPDEDELFIWFRTPDDVLLQYGFITGGWVPWVKGKSIRECLGWVT